MTSFVEVNMSQLLWSTLIVPCQRFMRAVFTIVNSQLSSLIVQLSPTHIIHFMHDWKRTRTNTPLQLAGKQVQIIEITLYDEIGALRCDHFPQNLTPDYTDWLPHIPVETPLLLGQCADFFFSEEVSLNITKPSWQHLVLPSFSSFPCPLVVVYFVFQHTQQTHAWEVWQAMPWAPECGRRFKTRP